MKRAEYVDTAPGADHMFSAPAGTEDYAAWLMRRYRDGEGRRIKIIDSEYTASLGGVNQRINALIEHARAGGRLRFTGPFKRQAREVFRRLCRKRPPNAHKPSPERPNDER